MEKLNPSKAQLKVMARRGAEMTWEDPEYVVSEMFAAANSIPEGPPVGTIARRPDGEWIAWRTEDGWGYRFIGDEEPNEWPPGSSIADFWPVIYDPTGKTLDELHAEIDRLDKAEDCALRERDYWEETVNRILYTCSSEDEIGEWSSANDPVERFIEQFKPVKRIDPTAQQEPALRERFPEQASAYVADPELAEVDDEPLPSGSLITPKPRTPRVVYRLGVDEQGAEWKRRGISRDSYIWEYRFRNGVWQVRLVGNEVWASMSPGTEPTNGPFTEVLEPRVLPSLDCEEARDGTVWQAAFSQTDHGRGWKFWYLPAKREWYTDEGHNEIAPLGALEFLTERGPYTEVFPDVAS